MPEFHLLLSSQSTPRQIHIHQVTRTELKLPKEKQKTSFVSFTSADSSLVSAMETEIQSVLSGDEISGQVKQSSVCTTISLARIWSGPGC